MNNNNSMLAPFPVGSLFVIALFYSKEEAHYAITKRLINYHRITVKEIQGELHAAYEYHAEILKQCKEFADIVANNKNEIFTIISRMTEHDKKHIETYNFLECFKKHIERNPKRRALKEIKFYKV